MAKFKYYIMNDLLLKTKRQNNLEATQFTFHSRTSFQMQFNPVQNETKSKTANKSISIATEIETIKMITTNLRTYTLHENRHTHTHKSQVFNFKAIHFGIRIIFQFQTFSSPFPISFSILYLSQSLTHTFSECK